jgi:hypothetical protein
MPRRASVTVAVFIVEKDFTHSPTAIGASPNPVMMATTLSHRSLPSTAPTPRMEPTFVPNVKVKRMCTVIVQ